MTSIENNVVIENVVEGKVRVKAKSFAQKDKKTMFSIMAFLKFLEEQGILADDKTLECLEALPLYQTAAEKTAFFQQDLFDIKVVENELYKPMVSDYKKAKKTKKERKPREKKQKEENVDSIKEPKPKKERKPKEKKQVKEEPVVQNDVEVEVKDPVVQNDVEVEVKEKVIVDKPKTKKERKPKGDAEPKRGRKPKQQIVELAQDVVPVEENDPLDVLIQAMNNTVEHPPSLSVPLPEEFDVDDVDDMLAELEAEEIVEKKVKVTTPVLVKEKEKKKKETVEKVAVVKKPKKTKEVVVDNNN
jgi:hypothetical protein